MCVERQVVVPRIATILVGVEQGIIVLDSRNLAAFVGADCLRKLLTHCSVLQKPCGTMQCSHFSPACSVMVKCFGLVLFPSSRSYG